MISQRDHPEQSNQERLKLNYMSYERPNNIDTFDSRRETEENKNKSISVEKTLQLRESDEAVSKLEKEVGKRNFFN